MVSKKENLNIRYHKTQIDTPPFITELSLETDILRESTYLDYPQDFRVKSFKCYYLSGPVSHKN